MLATVQRLQQEAEEAGGRVVGASEPDGRERMTASDRGPGAEERPDEPGPATVGASHDAVPGAPYAGHHAADEDPVR